MFKEEGTLLSSVSEDDKMDYIETINLIPVFDCAVLLTIEFCPCVHRFTGMLACAHV